MYTTLPGFVLGFHGCDESVVDAIVCGRDTLQSSQNDYDWLGHGVYFWENDPARALEYAQVLQAKPKRARVTIRKPAVLGAVIDLGHCLNLMESTALSLLHTTYELLAQSFASSGRAMPVNARAFSSSHDLLLRNLDCAVIELLHEVMTSQQQRTFDTVRGLFFEGDDLYPNAGFKEKNHVQICVRNPNCIKGYFIPRQQDGGFPLP